MADMDEMRTHLEDLLPVLRSLHEATTRLAATLPGPAHPVMSAQPLPPVDEALADINAAIDAYCAVSLDHSGLLGDPGSGPTGAGAS